MRGRPFIQALGFLAVWLLLAIPIFRVTQATVPAPVVAVEEVMDAAATPAWVELRFSRPPVSFSLRQGGVVLWVEDAPAGTRFERSIPLVLDDTGAEVHLTGLLPDGGETAVEVAVEPDGRVRRSVVLWVEGAVDDTVFFAWGSP
jgi:hypothetical protein